jgi:hypothetical protein
LDWIETYWTADGFNPDSVVEASLRQPPRLPDAGLMPTRASVDSWYPLNHQRAVKHAR